MISISPDQPWLQSLIATGHRMGISFAAASPRRWMKESSDGVATNRSIATFHLRGSHEIAVEVDEENKDYIHGCLAAGSKAICFVWFETVDGCLLGINLAYVGAVDWYSPDRNAPVRSSWTRDCVVMRFSDGTSMQLPEIRGETIEYLRGATIRAHSRKSFYWLSYADGRAVSINLETLMCVTMPAVWLDADP